MFRRVDPRLILLLPLGCCLMAAAASSVSVRPGGVVRWPGNQLDRCGRGDESWAPLDGTCFFPIDLLTAQGVVTIWRSAGANKETAPIAVTAYPYDTQRLKVDDRHVNLSKADLARSERESASVGKVLALRTDRRFSLPLGAPLSKLPPAGRFGARRIFNGVSKNPHNGADYAAATGTAVMATEAGSVVLSADHFFSGQSVFIDHGDGLVSMYFHLSQRSVEEGDVVRRGQKIGAVGATGRATGPHLHFGLRWRGARVDPAILLADPVKMSTVP